MNNKMLDHGRKKYYITRLNVFFLQYRHFDSRIDHPRKPFIVKKKYVKSRGTTTKNKLIETLVT